MRETGEPAVRFPRLSEIAPEMAWFEENRANLIVRCPGEFVAIVGTQVVDHDTDRQALAERVGRRYGARSVYMPQCVVEEAVVEVRSPSVVR